MLQPLVRPEAVAERHVAGPLAAQVRQQVRHQVLVEGGAGVAVLRVAACTTLRSAERVFFSARRAL